MPFLLPKIEKDVKMLTIRAFPSDEKSARFRVFSGAFS